MTSIPPFFSFILAEAAAAPKGPEGILSNPIIMPIIILVVFYFLLIRPQQIQRKQQAAKVAALQSGDKVVTSAGIHGIVHNVKDHTVVIKVAEGTMIEFDKLAVTTVHKKDSSK